MGYVSCGLPLLRVHVHSQAKQSVSQTFCACALLSRRKYFNEGIQSVSEHLVSATVELYNAIRSSLLPTPSKSHYTFNLRDLSKVVQGVMRGDPKTTAEPKQVGDLGLVVCLPVTSAVLCRVREVHGCSRCNTR
jgi:hypothetical protein